MQIISPKIVKSGLRGGVALAALGVGLMALPAQAQNTQPPATADAATANNNAQNDENIIIVTGSRIARPQVESSVPLAVVSSAAIANVGSPMSPTPYATRLW